MCGNVGVAGILNVAEEKAFKQLLVVDVLRGEHSTGVAVIPRHNAEPKIAKQVGNPFELFNDKRFDTAMGGMNRVIIGHNRFATQGAVNKANAHPFDFDNVVGAHNGTLSNKHALEGGNNFTVDSQALYNHIDKHGVEDAITKCMGAWALVWWDKNAETLNFLRNSERTLYTVMSEDGKKIFWASEWEMLNLVMNRNGMKYDKIKTVPVDTWVSIPVDSQGNLGEKVETKVAGKKPVVVVYQGGYKGNVQPAGNKNVSNGVVTRTGALFEIGEKFVDLNGAEYLSCLDAINKDIKVRLYINKGDEKHWRNGFVIKGDLLTYSSSEGGYYKITQSTVVLATTEEQVRFDTLAGRFQQPSNVISLPPTYKTHKGTWVAKEEWERLYPQCAWCTVDLVAENVNVFSKDGDCVCPDCSADEEVNKYL